MKTRRPTIEDLTSAQTMIYNSLNEETREIFLGTLPDVRLKAGETKKTTKQNMIQARIALVQQIRQNLLEHQEALTEVVNQLSNGLETDKVDLRHLLAPPELTGAVLRYVRGSQKKQSNEYTANDADEVMLSYEEGDEVTEVEHEGTLTITTVSAKSPVADFVVEPFVDDERTQYHNHSIRKEPGKSRKVVIAG